jgi:phenylacetate-CoA ligase
MSLSQIRKTIFDPLHSWVSGSPKVKYWKELEKSQFLPEEHLRELQWSRLKEMLTYIFENNNFYRQRFDRAGIEPADIQTVDDMVKIPVLKKDEIRQYTDLMISNGYRKDQLMEFKTGGSTGTSIKLYITEECSELRNAVARRHDRWSGWEIGEPIAAVWGNPILRDGLKGKIKSWVLSPIIYLDTMHVSNDSVKKFAAEWERCRPTLIFGHAHSIYILALYVTKLAIKNIQPKAIISTSMMLMPHERKIIEDVFQIKVTDRYGCEEVSLISSECEKHNGMHLNIEHLFIEFIKADGTYAKRGEEGTIIVTDLLNRAMPFIRYRVEDIGVPLWEKCQCGRGLPLMGKVKGRVADFLVKKDGGIVAGISLIERTLTAISGIDQLQIVQESIDDILLKVVKHFEFNIESETALLDEFHTVFGRDTQIRIEFVRRIEPEKSGKYRFSISRIANNYINS